MRADAMIWPVEQKLTELDSLTPVRGQVRARHHGSVLEVEGEGETIVTLCCDRCLQHFNRPLRATVHELLELAGPDAEDLEGSDLTALAASAAAAGASRRRSREPVSGSGASGSSSTGRSPGGRPPAADRDRGRSDAAARSERSPLQSSGPSKAPSAGSQPRRGSRARSQPDQLLIEALDDRLNPRGDFDPERWLFEQLSLQLPVVNRCGADCPGPPPARGNASTITPERQHRNPPAPQASAAAKSSSAEVPSGRAGSSGLQTSQSVSPQPSQATAVANAASASQTANDSTSAGAADHSSLSPGGAPPNAPAAAPPIDPRWAALRQLLP